VDPLLAIQYFVKSRISKCHNLKKVKPAYGGFDYL
jgi:hypothetical protein